MTIPQRILLHVALGAALVVAVASTVTYRRVYENAKQRELKHLETYVSERSRREEIGFLQAQANLMLVRGQFLKRIQAPIPRDYQTKWDARFKLFPDGSWRSYEKFADGRKFSTLWAHKNCIFTPELKTQVLRAQDICDELLPGWADAFPSVYFILPGWLNIGFDPRIPSWVWDTPAEYNATNLEWFQLAMPANLIAGGDWNTAMSPGGTIPGLTTNQSDAHPAATLRTKTQPDGFSWTGVIEEPTTKVPIVSLYLPIVKDGRFLGSIGHDKYVNQMMEEITHSDLSGARHVIFRGDGRIVAHPTKLKEILASKGQLRMQDSGEPALASLFRAASSRPGHHFSGYDEFSGSYYSVARLAGPEWFFLTTMPREQLQQQAFRSAQWVLWSGIISLALVLGFLATTLRRQIAHPLAELTRATRQMSSGDVTARATVGRKDELGALAGSFNEMALQVAARDAALRAEKSTLERRVSERTAELARFASIAESTGDFYGFADLQERLLYINPAGRRMIGLSPDESLAARSIRDVHPESAYEDIRRVMIPRGLREGACSGETELRHRDGSEIPVSLMIVIPRSSDGQPMFVSAIMRDITSRKKAEADLHKALARERELNELKSEFVSLVSHEFRTPLEIIMSSVDNLSRYHDRLAAEKREQLLQTINKSVRRMAGMMDEVLVLGRVESGRMEFKPVPFDLNAFCRRVSDEILSATGQRCPIELNVDAAPRNAVGDENILRHILTNLLSNAVKYSPENQPVSVELHQAVTDVVIRVTDRGCGIPPADQKRLFQAFHRGSNVRQTPGTGLGLVIVQRCVALHGGTIQFESVEGQGTTFVVRLPLFVEPSVIA